MNDNSAHKVEPLPVRAASASSHKGGHGWMMMICCIPMVIIAVALVAAGAVSPGFLVTAGLCVGMMAMMMRSMDHGTRRK